MYLFTFSCGESLKISLADGQRYARKRVEKLGRTYK